MAIGKRGRGGEPAQRSDIRIEGSRVGEGRELVEEAQLAGTMGSLELVQERAAVEAREHAHGQEKPGPAGDPRLVVGCEATTWDNAMDVRVMREGLPPGVQHHRGANLGAKMPRISCDRLSVSEAASNSKWIEIALFWNAIAATGAGRVKTMWKYATGSRSAARASSHSRAAPA